MVDFASLRNQILFGEGDETPREPSTVEKEALEPSTGIPLFLGAGTLAFCGLDKAKFDVLGAHRTIVAIALGVAPLDFGSHGLYGAAVGQESFGFGPSADLFAPRVSFESQTYGW